MDPGLGLWVKTRGGAREGSGVARTGEGLVGVVRLLSREWEDSVMVAREAGPGMRERRLSRVVWDMEGGEESNSSSGSSEKEGSGETSRMRGGSMGSSARGAGGGEMGDADKG